MALPKGFRHTRATKRKMSESHRAQTTGFKKGSKHTEATKKKIRDGMARAKARGWKPDTSGLIMDGFNQKHSAESRAKMSKSQTGLKRPNISERNKKWVGELAPNWRGGITPAKRLHRGKFLREVQPKVLARDNYTCQICQQYSGYLHADHIKSWAKYPDLRFDMDNCRTVCRPCHYYITFKRKMPVDSLWGLNSPLDRKAG